MNVEEGWHQRKSEVLSTTLPSSFSDPTPVRLYFQQKLIIGLVLSSQPPLGSCRSRRPGSVGMSRGLLKVKSLLQIGLTVDTTRQGVTEKGGRLPGVPG